MEPLPYSESNNSWDCSIRREKVEERIDQDLQNHERYKVAVNQIPQYENEEAPYENSGRSFFRLVKKMLFCKADCELLEHIATRDWGLGHYLEADLPSWPVDVSVAADCLEVRNGGSCEAAALPAEVRLAPSSCRGLRRLPADGLHLRMRLRIMVSAPEMHWNTLERLKPQKNYVVYCQSCGDIIVQDRKFLRVLPLPSENWSALVEEWCCHPNPFARSTLHPQHHDCFLGDTFFLLNSGKESHVPESTMCCSETGHHASQSGSNLKSKENTRVICKRCKTMLGEAVSSDTIKYYVTEVIIQPSEASFSPTSRSQFVQSMVAQCLVELSSAKSTFRFTVKGDNGKIYILIWLLNSDTLLVESLGSSSSHSVFTLFGDIFMPSSGPVGTWNAVKVLYQPCIKSRNKE
ncbi:PREDICTED: E3 ubiquitin-protein ligase E3D [Nipponia nippon]|uniref:E3 ubiquitin-protein ligase E3D n=1 Tax=Nipponia nippon TaxID=128390 RepID=UPI000511A7FC|nr:PREDICTED: E3 ubiquitin-protein ligase E3D [Nipponia nippon]